MATCLIHTQVSALSRVSLVAQTVKCPPAMRETWLWSLGQEGPLEKETATHSSILAWKIPWTEKPGGLQSMGLQKVGHDWETSLFLITEIQCLIPGSVRTIPWKWKWQRIPVFLPGKSHGQRSLADYSPWGQKESNTTEQLNVNNKAGPQGTH